MNAVVALCHFCEIHGPKILFTCQPFHEDVLPNVTSLREEKRFYGNYDLFERSDSNSASTAAPESLNESCSACKSSQAAGNQPAFLSNDHETRTSYVSSQYPYHPEIFSIVRNACLRSLSCEVCPGREGPIFFGDDQRGYTLSHTFTLKDSKARGFQHWYSIIVVSMDKLLLLNNYEFLVQNLKYVIEELQYKALIVFNQEQAECPEKSMRLAPTSRLASMPSDFLRQRAGSGGVRSMVELTGDGEVFVHLNRNFVFILKAGAERVVELVLDGHPTQDALVAMEQVEDEVEDGAIPPLPVVGNASFDSFVDLQSLYNTLEKEAFRLVAYHVVIGNQVIVQGPQAPLVARVIKALENLIPLGCRHSMLYSLVYLEPYQYNLLGLSDDVEPGVQHPHMLIYVTVSDGDSTASISDCMFRFRTNVEPPEVYPKVVCRYDQLLGDLKLTPSVSASIFSNTREEWLNKVKVVFQFTRQHPNGDPEQLRKITNALKCSDEDEPILKFWVAGLSRQYKQYVLNRCAKLQQQKK